MWAYMYREGGGWKGQILECRSCMGRLGVGTVGIQDYRLEFLLEGKLGGGYWVKLHTSPPSSFSSV